MRTLLIWAGLIVGAWATVILIGWAVIIWASDLIERAY